MKIEQIMTRPVWTCRPSDTLNIPAELMWENDVGCVVVQDEGKIVGIITDRDICMGAYTQGKPIWAIPVRESMATEPIFIQQNATVEAAEELMRGGRIRRLPVVNEEGALVGLLSLNDIAREAKRQRGKKLLDISLDGVAGTLAALCEPRKSESLMAVKSS
jgi:CBS domain-containing protein